MPHPNIWLDTTFCRAQALSCQLWPLHLSQTREFLIWLPLQVAKHPILRSSWKTQVFLLPMILRKIGLSHSMLIVIDWVSTMLSFPAKMVDVAPRCLLNLIEFSLMHLALVLVLSLVTLKLKFRRHRKMSKSWVICKKSSSLQPSTVLTPTPKLEATLCKWSTSIAFSHFCRNLAYWRYWL